VPDLPATPTFLTNVLGFRTSNQPLNAGELALFDAPDDDSIAVLECGDDRHASRLGVVAAPGNDRLRMGAGSVHHLAWRVPDREKQQHIREQLLAAGANVTPVIDRTYFDSIYFRIPGGVIFEVATDGPGFTADEPVDRLGSSLMLPPQHEPDRAAITASLPPIPEDLTPLLTSFD